MRETGQASLFSFVIGEVGVDGSMPISESHSKGEREQEEERAEECNKPKP
jgi:hypothetical protein